VPPDRSVGDIQATPSGGPVCGFCDVTCRASFHSSVWSPWAPFSRSIFLDPKVIVSGPSGSLTLRKCLSILSYFPVSHFNVVCASLRAFFLVEIN